MSIITKIESTQHIKQIYRPQQMAACTRTIARRYKMRETVAS